MTEPAAAPPPAPSPPPAPATPAEATARIAELRNDTAYGEKLFSGDVETTKEFHALHELAAKGDAIDHAMAGIMSGDIPSTEEKQMAGTAEFLRSVGMKDPVVRELLEGKGVTAEEMRAVQSWKQQHMKDADFVKRFLANDSEAVRLMTTANAVIANGIK